MYKNIHTLNSTNFLAKCFVWHVRDYAPYFPIHTNCKKKEDYKHVNIGIKQFNIYTNFSFRMHVVKKRTLHHKVFLFFRDIYGVIICVVQLTPNFLIYIYQMRMYLRTKTEHRWRLLANGLAGKYSSDRHGNKSNRRLVREYISNKHLFMNLLPKLVWNNFRCRDPFSFLKTQLKLPKTHLYIATNKIMNEHYFYNYTK